MKKLLSSLLLLTFISVNNLTFVLANEKWDTNAIQLENTLELLENKIILALDNSSLKIKDEDIKDKIEQKQQEIQQYIQESKDNLQWATKTEIKEKLEEIQKTVVLKAISWLTPTTDTTENISSQINITNKDIKSAETTLINSLQSDEWYILMIKSNKTKQEIYNLLSKFDTNIKLELQYDDEWYSVYELTISNNSLLQKELLENVDIWEVPNNLLWIQVIKPELLQIWNLDYTWEETDKLWWLKKYNITKYQSDIKIQSNTLTKKVRIWIVDTWIDYNHQDLKNIVNKNLWYDFVNDDNDPLDDQWHGTHVSWTIAWQINNTWVFWINPNIELVWLKICDNKWFCPSYAVINLYLDDV